MGGLGTAAGTVGEFFGGLVLALFITFFVLFDGPRMWSWLVGVFPRDHRAAVGPAGERAWGALVAYMRGIVIVALAISTGTVVAGIGGTVAAVPLVAAVYAAVRPREQSKDPPQESEQ
ncbi:MAG: AI-2E family transporter [Solirubrobacterales bacterium]|nr:AI-2E family transporter [Solirubrobacterales bacterium]